MDRFFVVLTPGRQALQFLLTGMMALAVARFLGHVFASHTDLSHVFLTVAILLALLLFSPWIAGLFAIYPTVWVNDGRLYSRPHIFRPIRSVPVSFVSTDRIVRPRWHETWFTGVRMRAPDGSRAVIPVGRLNPAERRALADAVLEERLGAA